MKNTNEIDESNLFENILSIVKKNHFFYLALKVYNYFTLKGSFASTLISQIKH